MGTLRQEYYKVLVFNDNQWHHVSSDGWSSLPHNISAGSNSHISKLSIEAPPGFELDIDGRTIIVGRSGLYDLDNEDLKIHAITFQQPKQASIQYGNTVPYAAALNTIASTYAAATDTTSFANALIQSYTFTPPETSTSATFTAMEIAQGYLNALNGSITYTSGGDAENIIINYIVEEGS